MTGLLTKISSGVGSLILVGALGLAGYSYFSTDKVKTKITDAQMTQIDGSFMIATDYRPFVNEDAWYRFKFNSGTVQNDAIRLKGKNVEIAKYGWRNPLFSMYENITDIKEIE